MQMTLDALRGSLESALDRAAAAKADPGRAMLRRLNRTEYANAIRDLLGLEVDVSTLLPFDNSSYGFDNIADVLGVSPVLMERYLVAARRISALAVGDAAEIIATADTYRVRPDVSQDQPIEGLPLGTRGGIRREAHVSARRRIHLQDRPPAGDAEQRRRPGVSAYRRHHASTAQKSIARRSAARTTSCMSYANSQGAAEALEARLAARVKVRGGRRTPSAPRSSRRPRRCAPDCFSRSCGRHGIRSTTRGVPHIDALVVTGPFNDDRPRRYAEPPADLSCRPSGADGARVRPPNPVDAGAAGVPPAADAADVAHARCASISWASTREALRVGYRDGRCGGFWRAPISCCASSAIRRARPGRDPAGHRSRAGLTAVVFPVEHASRRPAARCRRSADGCSSRRSSSSRFGACSRIRAPGRSSTTSPAVAATFATSATSIPTPDEFPDFDDNLRQAMLQRGRAVLREHHPGGPQRHGSHDGSRHVRQRASGASTTGSRKSTAVTSGAWRCRRTSGAACSARAPFSWSPRSPRAPRRSIRGKWVLENIVGTPPPPPPPDVPALDEVVAGQPPRSLRERTRDASSRSHLRGLPPDDGSVGFALEPFDAVGEWRLRDGGAPIDASGRLMDGAPVDGPAIAPRRARCRNPEIFVATMTEKLMIYALGRGLKPADLPRRVRRIVDAARDNYRFSAIVAGHRQQRAVSIEASRRLQ